MSDEMERLRRREVDNYFKHENQRPTPYGQIPRGRMGKWVVIGVIVFGVGQCFSSMTQNQERGQPSQPGYSRPRE